MDHLKRPTLFSPPWLEGQDCKILNRYKKHPGWFSLSVISISAVSSVSNHRENQLAIQDWLIYKEASSVFFFLNPSSNLLTMVRTVKVVNLLNYSQRSFN